MQFQAKVDKLTQLLSPTYTGELGIIHGDFFPGNLIVHNDGTVLGVIDFGMMTMYGDPLFDVATGWVLFDMYDELRVNIKERLLTIIIDELGEEIRPSLYIYVLLYNIYTCNYYAKDCSDGHYAWCVRNLNDAALWKGLLHI